MRFEYKTIFISFGLFFFLFSPNLFPEEIPMDQQREKMVQEQIVARGIKDERVLAAMRKIERHRFVPSYAEDAAYQDYPLPIGYGQTISQPYIVAYMTEILELKGNERVLEIGTGSGYQAAVLAQLAGQVYSIEILPPLATESGERLKKLGFSNIEVKAGNGYEGWPENAPFDAIIVTAAPEEIPYKLMEQLKVGGKMIVPVGSEYQELKLITKTASGNEEKKLIPVRFVPMVGPKS